MVGIKIESKLNKKEDATMNFPDSPKKIKVILSNLDNGAKSAMKKIKILEKEIEILEKEKEKNLEIKKIFKGLLVAWKHPDPGKYYDAFFFLNSKMKRVVVQEFLPKGTKICHSSEEWEAYEKTRSWHGAEYNVVPYWYPVVSLSEVAKGVCPQCKLQEPNIEHYVQTDDSPEGDQWVKEYFILCIDCKATFVRKFQASSNRF